jgi:L-histidine Nalpha-methyltransferase
MAATADQIAIEVHLPEGGSWAGMAEDVREGLSCPFKELPPKYFYDERGSALFEAITELDEYYPTRAERSILEARADEIIAAAEPTTLIELGSGAASKTRALLDAMRDAGTLETYVPVDISEEITRRAAAELVAEYEGLRVHGVVCDYETHLERVPREEGALIAFLGGTIGNFRPASRRSFLARIATLMYPGDRFLLGTDLVKDPAVLELAYNDPGGVTEDFNKNVLCVLNRETPTSTPPPSSTSLSGTPRTNGWTFACARSPSNSSTCERSTCARISPATKRCGPRSRPSSPATVSSRATATPGWSWSSGGPTRTSSTRFRWRSRFETRGRPSRRHRLLMLA